MGCSVQVGTELQDDEHPLAHVGWDDAWRAALEEVAEEPDLVAARIVAEHRGGYELLTADGPTGGVAAGRLRHGDRPAVGDWAAVRPLTGEDRAVMRTLLPRRTAVRRKVAGLETAEQVVAANVDVVACVVAASDVNVRRLERYLAVAWESGATPLVVVTKSELGDAAEIEQVAVGVEVVHTSAHEGWGIDDVHAHIGPGRTAVLVGPSGAGKSTLVNALLHEDRMATGGVRASDGRGRHTTTHRQLLAVPDGGVVIDTPGLREIGIWDTEGIESAFTDVTDAAERCRFRDCAHEAEPGCAVVAEVDPERLAAWRKLEKEAAWLERRKDARAQAESEKRWKGVAQENRRNPSPKR